MSDIHVFLIGDRKITTAKVFVKLGLFANDRSNNYEQVPTGQKGVYRLNNKLEPLSSGIYIGYFKCDDGVIMWSTAGQIFVNRIFGMNELYPKRLKTFAGNIHTIHDELIKKYGETKET